MDGPHLYEQTIFLGQRLIQLTISLAQVSTEILGISTCICGYNPKQQETPSNFISGGPYTRKWDYPVRPLALVQIPHQGWLARPTNVCQAITFWNSHMLQIAPIIDQECTPTSSNNCKKRGPDRTTGLIPFNPPPRKVCL